MNLYQFHSNPSKLIGYDAAFDQVPELAWNRYNDNILELKKREHLWKKNVRCSYLYALDILNGRFLEGEAIIATSAHWSCWYAADAIKRRFPEGEAAIVMSALYSYYYALYALKKKMARR